MSRSAAVLSFAIVPFGFAFPRSLQAPPETGGTTHTQEMLDEGKKTFRFDTFGDEIFWGRTLRLHEAIEGAALGGVGPGLSPVQALGLGLKIDSDMLPNDLKLALRANQVDLDDPRITVDLLGLGAVVGVTGFLTDQGRLRTIGIQCALCHSTVDDSFGPGMGQRLDGWPNRDLDVGRIIAAAPDLSAFANLLGISQHEVREVLLDWGPGKFDAQLILDGKAYGPTGRTAAQLIPPAYGLAGVNLHTSTGWGSVTYWNAFVAVLEMHGQGTFYDERLDDAVQFPVAARAGFSEVESENDRVTPKLAALHAYQLSLEAPKPPPGSFDAAAAERGDVLFETSAGCAECHVEPLFTEPGWNLHKPGDIGIDPFQANRSPEKRYRTSPLRGLWSRQKGGFFHDGQFPTLLDVVEHYNQHFQLGLTAGEKSDLVQYLLSL